MAENEFGVVIHSGGMDSSICLAMAVQNQKKRPKSLTFFYDQRHQVEIVQAKKIAEYFDVGHETIDLGFLSQISRSNALLQHDLKIQGGEKLNTAVYGRNALMVLVASIRANYYGFSAVTTGVLELEEANSGYKDCSRRYMDQLQGLLRMEYGLDFSIRTPLVFMTKCETMIEAKKLGVLDYLLEETVSCYEGIQKVGCRHCPACRLRNQAIYDLMDMIDFDCSYKDEIRSLFKK